MRCLATDVVHVVIPGERGVEDEPQIFMFVHLVNNISTYPDCEVNCWHSFLPENQKRSFFNIHIQKQSNHSKTLSTAFWSSVANMVGSPLATYSDVSSTNRLVKEV